MHSALRHRRGEPCRRRCTGASGICLWPAQMLVMDSALLWHKQAWYCDGAGIPLLRCLHARSSFQMPAGQGSGISPVTANYQQLWHASPVIQQSPWKAARHHGHEARGTEHAARLRSPHDGPQDAAPACPMQLLLLHSRWRPANKVYLKLQLRLWLQGAPAAARSPAPRPHHCW